MNKEMNGKKVFISGGTGGVGFAAAKQFAAQGATVAITGRTVEKGEAAVQEMRNLGARCIFLQGNSGSVEEMQRAAAQAAEFMGGIDTMVSAGAENLSGLKSFVEMPAEYIRATIDSLIYPRIFPVQAALPYMRSGGGGSVVMVCTDAARHPTPGESIVGGTGAMIMLLTKALARELSKELIRVNAVAMTITSGTPGWDRGFASELGKKVFTKALSRFPFGRAPEAGEVADAIVFLSSGRAAQISGQTLSVNGALSFGGW